MVNSTANINKTNNHLSPKESLNSDGQQYRQYPQNEQPPLTSNHWTLKKKTTNGSATKMWQDY
jgi:poly(3-hydroxyalkanoate) synthetase